MAGYITTKKNPIHGVAFWSAVPTLNPKDVTSIQADCDELAAILLLENGRFAHETPDTGRVRCWTGEAARNIYEALKARNI